MQPVYDQDQEDELVDEATDEDHSELHDDVDQVDETRVRRGDVVSVSWLDTATLEDSVRYGTVVDVVDDETSGPAVRVGWFTDVSDPLPLDHTIHGRDDAPRVEVLDDDES